MKDALIHNLNKLPYIISLQARIHAQKEQIKKLQLNRYSIARHYLAGEGIEIGALHNPLPVEPGTARVKYVDRMPVEELYRQYPELKTLPLVPVDIVADGEKLETISDESQDFVIANHFIEHCQSPLLALENMLRVLRRDGIVFMAVPDKRYTFDKNRPVTTVDHLLRDYYEGPLWSRHDHFREWVRLVENISDQEELEKKVDHLLNIDYSFHYLVWTKCELDELLLVLIDKLKFPMEVEFSMLRREGESIFILRKV